MIDKSTITSFGLKAVIGIALIIALVGIVQKSLFMRNPVLSTMFEPLREMKKSFRMWDIAFTSWVAEIPGSGP